MARSLRPSRADDLGLRRALSDRLLPLLVAAMIFLAALALAGAEAASSLARHWHTGAASMIMVQVPRPLAAAGTAIAGRQLNRAEAVAVALAGAPGVAVARRLPDAEIGALLRPWLGEDPARLSLPLPAVFEVRLTEQGAQSAPAAALSAPAVGPSAPAVALDALLTRDAPGTLVERSGVWMTRLAELVDSLQACAGLALVVVAFVATAMVSVATRAGLAARRDAIEIVHGLGANDGMIARQFSRRITSLVLVGAVLGLVLSVPVLLSLATLSAPFQPAAIMPPGAAPGAAPGALPGPAALLGTLPPLLWAALAALPAGAALIGWVTAQATVRGWLAELP